MVLPEKKLHTGKLHTNECTVIINVMIQSFLPSRLMVAKRIGRGPMWGHYSEDQVLLQLGIKLKPDHQRQKITSQSSQSESRRQEKAKDQAILTPTLASELLYSFWFKTTLQHLRTQKKKQGEKDTKYHVISVENSLLTKYAEKSIRTSSQRKTHSQSFQIPQLLIVEHPQEERLNGMEKVYQERENKLTYIPSSWAN